MGKIVDTRGRQQQVRFLEDGVLTGSTALTFDGTALNLDVSLIASSSVSIVGQMSLSGALVASSSASVGGGLTITGNVTAANLGTMAAQDADAYVAEADYNAHTILASSNDDAPTAKTINEQEVVGRLTGGVITGIDIGIADDNILQVDDYAAADDDYCRFTSTGVEGRTPAEVLADIGALSDTGGTLTGDLTVSASIIASSSVSVGGMLTVSAGPVHRTFNLSITAGQYDGDTLSKVCYQAIGIGELMRLSTDGLWALTDADAKATTIGKLGLATASYSSGDTGVGLIYGILNSSSGFGLVFIDGYPYYVSTVAGDLSSDPPSGGADCVRIAGHAVADNIFFIEPSPNWGVIAA